MLGMGLYSELILGSTSFVMLYRPFDRERTMQSMSGAPGRIRGPEAARRNSNRAWEQKELPIQELARADAISADAVVHYDQETSESLLRSHEAASDHSEYVYSIQFSLQHRVFVKIFYSYLPALLELQGNASRDGVNIVLGLVKEVMKTHSEPQIASVYALAFFPVSCAGEAFDGHGQRQDETP